MDIRPGTTIPGEKGKTYEVHDLLGGGAFGLVYRLKGSDGNDYALKTISTAFLDDEKLAALQNEGKLAMRISHPNVIRVLYFHDGMTHAELPPYMVSEYASDGTLHRLLRAKQPGQFFTNDEVRGMFIQLAEGMKAVNDVLVHRDVKPDNILVADGVLKVVDFGLSKIAGAATRTNTFKGINHVMYCAPEAWRLETNAMTMDVYSMGLVFYEIATLRHAYDVSSSSDEVEAWKNAHILKMPADPRTINAQLDLGIAQVILKMLAKRPADRYQSWDDVLRRLRENSAMVAAVPMVTRLVERALASKRRDDEEQARQQRVYQEAENQHARLKYAFRELLSTAQQIVNAFNAVSDTAQLFANELPYEYAFVVNKRDSSGTAARVEAVFPNAERRVEGKRVLAWGMARAPRSRGFNLLLLQESAADIYGSWYVLEAERNPMFSEPGTTYELAPFDYHELATELGDLRVSFHVWILKLKPFQPEHFESLFEGVL
jgi:serine/threonine protein kinase